MTVVDDIQFFPAGAGAAFVSGGTGGLGSEVVSALAAQGIPVAFGYHSNVSAAEQLVATVADAGGTGGTAEAHQVDLTDATALKAVFDGLVARHGALRYLVHAAGPHIPMKFLSQVDPADYLAQLGADAGTYFSLVHAALPALRESKGNVVAITTSAIAHYGIKDGMSSTTKIAIDHLSRGFAVEEGRFGVRFNLVGPGMTTDGIGAKLIASGELSEAAIEVARRNTPLQKFADAQDIVAVVLFLASDRAKSLTGQKLNVDNGWSL